MTRTSKEVLKWLYWPVPYKIKREANHLKVMNRDGKEICIVRLSRAKRDPNRDSRRATAMYIVHCCNHYPEFLKALKAMSEAIKRGEALDSAIHIQIDAALKAAGE